MNRSTLIKVYVALVVLLALTIGIALLPVGGWVKATAGLTIAVMKGLLIATVFMHLKYQKGTTRVFAVAGLFWLLILFVLTASDYLTRQWF